MKVDASALTAAHFTQQQPDVSCWNLAIKTIKDAQKERRNPRNQREIQPQKMIASRQSWCPAIQTYEDTWSFGASKLSHQNCQTMLFGFPRLSFYILKWHRRSCPSRASAFLRQSLSCTSTRYWQDLKISRFQKKAILIEQNWAKANSSGGYRLRIHGMGWKCQIQSSEQRMCKERWWKESRLGYLKFHPLLVPLGWLGDLRGLANQPRPFNNKTRSLASRVTMGHLWFCHLGTGQDWAENCVNTTQFLKGVCSQFGKVCEASTD